eukprot:4542770-Alexandrium_andersonii.AAC.1
MGSWKTSPPQAFASVENGGWTGLDVQKAPSSRPCSRSLRPDVLGVVLFSPRRRRPGLRRTPAALITAD